MKKKHLLWVVLPLAIICGMAIWFFISHQTPAENATPTPQKQPPLVEVKPVQVTSITSTLELTGEVVASSSAIISTMKEGRIESCPCREGDTIESGETLIVIDREVHRGEAQAAQAALSLAQAKLEDLMAGTRPEMIQNAEANLRRRQATLDEASRSFQRQTELFEQDVISHDALDKAQERMEVAEADVAAASDTLSMLKAGSTTTELNIQRAMVNEAAARLDLANAHLAECFITAPFGGTISKVHVRPGDIASPREPLVELFDPTSLVIQFAVPEAHAATVHPGMAMGISFDATPDSSFSAEITRVYPELDPVMRTRTIEVVIADPTELAPHMFARLALQLAQDNSALVVPSEAVLLTTTGKRQLYVIEDGKAALRPITTGIEDGVNIQILSGVDAGEQVAVAGNRLLKPGMAVRVVKGQGEAKGHSDQGAPTGPAAGTQP